MFIFYVLLPYNCFPFVFGVVALDRFFFIKETKKWLLVVLDRWLVVLYNNNYMGICLGGLSTDHLRRVVVL